MRHGRARGGRESIHNDILVDRLSQIELQSIGATDNQNLGSLSAEKILAVLDGGGSLLYPSKL